MSGKTKKYLLLALVVAIWGVIGYRFLSLTESDEERIAPIRIQPIGLEQSEQSSYQFQLNYTDPFLKTVPVEEVPVQTSVQPEPVRTSFERIPEIRLKGIVSSRQNKAALVQINGHSNHMVTKGQEFEGFRMLGFGENQISILHLSSDSTMTLQVSRQ
ncbi:hypothetical protein [Marinoscillum sp.]|uniref:hypothetical protein n=1 Tax=Marinoscillum sp. TaxID=2024838 RepID=UPI003BA9BFB7